MGNEVYENSFVMVCKNDGKIETILSNKVLSATIRNGDTIFDFLLPESKTIWDELILSNSDNNNNDNAIHWKGFLTNVKGFECFCLLFKLDREQILIIGMLEYAQRFLYEEVSRINSQLTNNIRKVFKESVFNESNAYEELSKINNEFSNMRRELKKKNLELEEMNKRLEELSIRDPLTGLFNRRYFFMELPRIVARSKRSGLPVCLIMIDINGFKKVNDSMGHDEGDNLLRYIARCFEKVGREGQDNIFRFGGDEFLVILEQCDILTAQTVMNRFVIQYEIESKGTSLAMGIYTINSDQINEDFTQYIKAADELMYLEKAKMKIRNKE